MCETSHVKILPALVTALLLLPGILRAEAPIIREPGVIYLSDFGEKPMRVGLVRAAPCYFDRTLSRYAGTLRFPQAVRVEAFAEEACRIRGDARQGGVAAWVPYAELEPLPDNFLENLHAAEERRRTVEELIARQEVAIGMTGEEVERSVGRPQKRSKRADASGLQQTWEYIRYELVPQVTYGPAYNRTIIQQNPTKNSRGKTLIVTGNTGLAASTTYLKVPVGRLTVVFEEGIVSSLEESEGTLSGGQISIVAPPLEVY
jgi:hypothetical protein